MKRSAFFLTFLYACVVIVLSIMGYTEANSLVSLIVGGSFGLFILICTFLGLYTLQRWPFFLIVGALVCLLISFLIRFSATQGFMPAMMSLFTALTATLLSIWLASHKGVS